MTDHLQTIDNKEHLDGKTTLKEVQTWRSSIENNEITKQQTIDELVKELQGTEKDLINSFKLVLKDKANDPTIQSIQQYIKKTLTDNVHQSSYQRLDGVGTIGGTNGTGGTNEKEINEQLANMKIINDGVQVVGGLDKDGKEKTDVAKKQEKSERMSERAFIKELTGIGRLGIKKSKTGYDMDVDGVNIPDGDRGNVKKIKQALKALMFKGTSDNDLVNIFSSVVMLVNKKGGIPSQADREDYGDSTNLMLDDKKKHRGKKDSEHMYELGRMFYYSSLVNKTEQTQQSRTDEIFALAQKMLGKENLTGDYDSTGLNEQQQREVFRNGGIVTGDITGELRQELKRNPMSILKDQATKTQKVRIENIADNKETVVTQVRLYSDYMEAKRGIINSGETFTQADDDILKSKYIKQDEYGLGEAYFNADPTDIDRQLMNTLASGGTEQDLARRSIIAAESKNNGFDANTNTYNNAVGSILDLDNNGLVDRRDTRTTNGPQLLSIFSKAEGAVKAMLIEQGKPATEDAVKNEVLLNLLQTAGDYAANEGLEDFRAQIQTICDEQPVIDPITGEVSMKRNYKSHEMAKALNENHAFVVFLQKFMYGRGDDPLNMLMYGNGEFNQEKIDNPQDRTEGIISTAFDQKTQNTIDALLNRTEQQKAEDRIATQRAEARLRLPKTRKNEEERKVHEATAAEQFRLQLINVLVGEIVSHPEKHAVDANGAKTSFSKGSLGVGKSFSLDSVLKGLQLNLAGSTAAGGTLSVGLSYTNEIGNGGYLGIHGGIRLNAMTLIDPISALDANIFGGKTREKNFSRGDKYVTQSSMTGSVGLSGISIGGGVDRNKYEAMIKNSEMLGSSLSKNMGEVVGELITKVGQPNTLTKRKEAFRVIEKTLFGGPVHTDNKAFSDSICNAVVSMVNQYNVATLTDTSKTIMADQIAEEITLAMISDNCKEMDGKRYFGGAGLTLHVPWSAVTAALTLGPAGVIAGAAITTIATVGASIKPRVHKGLYYTENMAQRSKIINNEFAGTNNQEFLKNSTVDQKIDYMNDTLERTRKQFGESMTINQTPDIIRATLPGSTNEKMLIPMELMEKNLLNVVLDETMKKYITVKVHNGVKYLVAPIDTVYRLMMDSQKRGSSMVLNIGDTVSSHPSRHLKLQAGRTEYITDPSYGRNGAKEYTAAETREKITEGSLSQAIKDLKNDHFLSDPDFPYDEDAVSVSKQIFPGETIAKKAITMQIDKKVGETYDILGLTSPAFFNTQTNEVTFPADQKINVIRSNLNGKNTLMIKTTTLTDNPPEKISISYGKEIKKDYQYEVSHLDRLNNTDKAIDKILESNPGILADLYVGSQNANCKTFKATLDSGNYIQAKDTAITIINAMGNQKNELLAIITALDPVNNTKGTAEALALLDSALNPVANQVRYQSGGEYKFGSRKSDALTTMRRGENLSTKGLKSHLNNEDIGSDSTSKTNAIKHFREQQNTLAESFGSTETYKQVRATNTFGMIFGYNDHDAEVSRVEEKMTANPNLADGKMQKFDGSKQETQDLKKYLAAELATKNTAMVQNIESMITDAIGKDFEFADSTAIVNFLTNNGPQTLVAKDGTSHTINNVSRDLALGLFARCFNETLMLTNLHIDTTTSQSHGVAPDFDMAIAHTLSKQQANLNQREFGLGGAVGIRGGGNNPPDDGQTPNPTPPPDDGQTPNPTPTPDDGQDPNPTGLNDGQDPNGGG